MRKAIIAGIIALAGCTATRGIRYGTIKTANPHYAIEIQRDKGLELIAPLTISGNEVAYLRRGNTWINFGLFESENAVLPDWNYVKPLSKDDEFIHTHKNNPFPSIADIIQYFENATPGMRFTIRSKAGCVMFYINELSIDAEKLISQKYNPELLKDHYEELRHDGLSESDALAEVINNANDSLEGKMILCK